MAQTVELSQIEERTLNYILQNKELSFLTDEGITVDYFTTYPSAYTFILDYYKNYNSIPDKATFFEKFPAVEYLDVSGLTKEAIINELRSNNITINTISSINTLTSAIKNLNTSSDNNIVSAVESLTKDLNSLLVKNQSVQYTKFDDLPDKLREHFTDVQENFKKHFYPTGLNWLDRNISGWSVDSDYVVVAGRPGTGKSMLLCKFAAESFKQGLRVGYYSGEMSMVQTLNRIISCLYGISANKIARGSKDVEFDYFESLSKFKNARGKFFILTPDDLGGVYATTNNLEAFCRRENIDILFIDQQSLMTDLEHARVPFERAANISRQIKALRDRLKIPVICAVQLNRTKTEDGSVNTNQLAGSDVIGQDATKVLILQREHAEDNTIIPQVSIHIAKNRDNISYINKLFDINFDLCQFNEVMDDSEEAQPTQVNSYSPQGTSQYNVDLDFEQG